MKEDGRKRKKNKEDERIKQKDGRRVEEEVRRKNGVERKMKTDEKGRRMKIV